jgi:ATP-dependent DNA helicase RecG
MSEQQNIEYKQSWHDDYLKWVCGFANAIGGVIFIGKDDKGNVVHLKDYAKLLEDIPNKIRDVMGIICDVQLHDEQGKKYISIQVNPYSVAVSLRGRYYYRSGSVKMELTGVELNEFLLKKAGNTWDDVVEEGATIKDIDENSIAKFIEESREQGRMPEIKGLSTFQILEKLQLTKGHKLKRAAIILFGKDPNMFYPNIQVKIGRFGKDSTDLKFHEIVEGNLIQMLEEVQNQLNHKFLIRPVDFIGMQRVEKDEYPIAALREMILNALVHRNYMGAHIQLRVYDDKLSIWNEGGLPLGLTLEELKEEHNSRPRNPKIAKACFMAGYIDAWGRGTLKIYNSCKEHGLPEPTIIEKDGGVMVTLLKTIPVNDGGTIGGTIGGAIGGTIEDLTDRQKEILELINRDSKLSIRKLAQTLDINNSAVQGHLDILREKGIIVRIGKTRGYWKIMIEL